MALRARWFIASMLLAASSVLLAAEGDIPQPVRLPKLASPPASFITLKGPDGVTQLSFADLENLGTYQVTTATFWPEDDGTYSGPLLADVLKHSGLDQADRIQVRARDGFSQILPRQDWTTWPIILATRRDGTAMTPRNKGPYRIIYPRNQSAELTAPVYRLRWVWLVEAIEPVTSP